MYEAWFTDLLYVSQSRTSRFHGYIELRYRSKCNRHSNNEGEENMYHPEKLAAYGTQKKKEHEHICAGHNYIHTNTNTANKPSY
jgi:hypothetical protein